MDKEQKTAVWRALSGLIIAAILLVTSLCYLAIEDIKGQEAVRDAQRAAILRAIEKETAQAEKQSKGFLGQSWEPKYKTNLKLKTFARVAAYW